MGKVKNPEKGSFSQSEKRHRLTNFHPEKKKESKTRMGAEDTSRKDELARGKE